MYGVCTVCVLYKQVWVLCMVSFWDVFILGFFLIHHYRETKEKVDSSGVFVVDIAFVICIN